jgi:hypothetical protein
MGAYQDILEDILQLFSINVVDYPPPYEPHADSRTKFLILNEELRCAKSQHNRLALLVNTFYLGQLLERDIKSKESWEYIEHNYLRIIKNQPNTYTISLKHPESPKS